MRKLKKKIKRKDKEIFFHTDIWSFIYFGKIEHKFLIRKYLQLAKTKCQLLVCALEIIQEAENK